MKQADSSTVRGSLRIAGKALQLEPALHGKPTWRVACISEAYVESKQHLVMARPTPGRPEAQPCLQH